MEISGRDLLKALLYKLFTSDVIIAIINILLPCVLSMAGIFLTENPTVLFWICIIIFVIIFLYNCISVILKGKKNKETQMHNLIYRCYEEQGAINNKFANQIYRLNKSISRCLISKTPIPEEAWTKADFQSFAFSICESIQTMIKNEYGRETECEVTVMRKENDNINMIAYANNNNVAPSSYQTIFNASERDIVFVKLFNELNADPLCLPNQKEVLKYFKKLKGSEIREGKICQYIGIPLKTNRQEIELLLQIDVSKKNIFGKSENEMKDYAKNVLNSYVSLLHKTYERDIIFKQYYETMLLMFSKNKE